MPKRRCPAGERAASAVHEPPPRALCRYMDFKALLRTPKNLGAGEMAQQLFQRS